MKHPDRPHSWPLERSQLQREFSLYRVRRDTVRSPRDGRTHDFDIVEAPNAVVVLAIDALGDLVMVEQFRHGIRELTLEFPGGIVEDDDPLEAARRELREETGYEAAVLDSIGTLDLNPSWETTRVHVILARNATRTAEKDEDDGEDTRVLRVSRRDARRFVLEGRMSSAVAVAALHVLEVWEQDGAGTSKSPSSDAAFAGVSPPNEEDELETAKRDLARKSVRLTRMVEEIERKLEENERLSSMLQYQNEEIEKQNEELLAMTEELHAGQEGLLQANQQLEMRSRQLQVALSARNRFYAAMSHELRTPINAVMGYNDLLLSGVYGPLNERQELALDRSQRAVRHLRALVNDVLDISTIELGRMEIVAEDVNLSQLVESLLESIRPLADSRGSPLHLDMGESPTRIVTDPRCLRQILLNIVTTAIRLASGAPVWIQCSPDPSGIVIEVTDDGGGLSAEDVHDVFDEFASLGEASPGTGMGGTGLGLPVARRLAALIGGRLDASSSPGVGNVFRLELPITLAHPPSSAGTGSEPVR